MVGVRGVLGTRPLRHPYREGGCGRRPHRGNGSLASALSLVVATALALTACSPSSGEDGTGAVATSSAATPADPMPLPRERVQAELAVAGEPDWLTVAFGSVWVARDEAGAVDRIAPDTNKVIATVAVGGHPCNGMTSGFGSIWVASCSENALYRVSGQTAKVEATIKLPVYQSLKGRPPSGGLATGHGAVWMVTEGAPGSFDTLAQVDPRTNKVVRRVALGRVGGRVAADDGAVWVTAPSDGMLLRVDPRTGEVVEIPGLVQPTAVTTGLGAVWVLSGRWVDHPNGDGSVTKVDPTTNTVVTRIRIEDPTGTPGSLVVDNGFLRARTSATALAKIDPGPGQVLERYRNDRGNGDLAVGFGSLWLSDFVFNTVRRLAL